MKTIYLVRGLPGSGKTTLSHELCEKVFSADDFFDKKAKKEGLTYEEVFDPTELPQAHKGCQEATRKAMEEGENVAVANTFSQRWEARPYLKMSEEFGYSVFVIECQSRFGNVHGVPEAAIDAMHERWESIA